MDRLPYALTVLLALTPLVAGRDPVQRHDVGGVRVNLVRPDARVWGARAAGPVVQRLRGPLGRLVGGGTPPRQLATLLGRYGRHFGRRGRVALGAARVISHHDDGRPDAVRVPQTVHGFEALGHGLVARFDERGHLHEVHGVLGDALAELPPPELDRGEGWEAALRHLVGPMGLDHDDLIATRATWPIARVLEDGAHLVWRTEVVLRTDLSSIGVDVDAHDGSILEVFDNTVHGGTFVSFGEQIRFSTGKGSGSVYRTIDDAALAATASAVLPAIATEDVMPSTGAVAGTLVGRFAHVIDNEDYVVQAPAGLDFPFDDEGVPDEAEAFDHVNTYYWLTRAAKRVRRLFRGFDSDYAMPAVVNVDGMFNAFYSTADLGLGHGSGYFAFGQFDEYTGDVMDDFSRDPSIVAHEYTHGAVEKMGIGLLFNPVDTPPRAVNEAVADYFAAGILEDARVGGSFIVHSGGDLAMDGDALRNLAEPKVFPTNLFDVTSGGKPQEHAAGHIFGAALWRARGEVGAGRFDRAVARSMPSWPVSTAEVGIPYVNAQNAEIATAAFNYECLEPILEQLENRKKKRKGRKLAMRALGAFMTHGVMGQRGIATYELDTRRYRRAKFDAAFLGGLDEHDLDLELRKGQRVWIVVSGHPADGTLVDVSLDATNKQVRQPKGKAVLNDGQRVKLRKMKVKKNGTYRVTFGNPGGLGGRYHVKIRVK